MKEKEIKVKLLVWFVVECEEVEGKTLKFASSTRVVSIGSYVEGGCFNVFMNGDGGVVVDVVVEMFWLFF